ncbi:MAG: hypothetical protein HQ528_01520, partial [Candidatus Marinimicrobia bacterium]|nr:hypothetical protein [Candidatus Neomarinimicrobiota bacterium]
MATNITRSLSVLIILIVCSIDAQTDLYDTGGPLMPEQAAYDVTFYDLDLNIDP